MQFMQTLYDQKQPVGNRPRIPDTHYSIFTARVWHSAEGALLSKPQDHTFAVIWDRDHDERVFRAIETLYAQGLLPNVKFIGERKGSLSIVPINPRANRFPAEIGLDDDVWCVYIVDTPETAGGDPEYYFADIEARWALGSQPVKIELEKEFTWIDPFEFEPLPQGGAK